MQKIVSPSQNKYEFDIHEKNSLKSGSLDTMFSTPNYKLEYRSSAQ